jgi:phthalate 4,5-dioxygenase
VHAEVDDDYIPLRNLRNDYLIDRMAQKDETFTGIVGVSEQDAAIQDSMGPIQDRTREHLGPTDLGVVEFRKLLMGAARSLQAGTAPRAAASPHRYAVRAGGAVAGPTRPLDVVMTERFGHRDGYVGKQYGLSD